MYKGLYDCFQHWFHDGKGQVYFISDFHFNDDEMKYLRKNYPGDEEQVKSINKIIGKYDTLICLGDVGDLEYIKKLRGYKVLILGNHDKGASIYKDYFNEIYEGCLMISPKVILSHEEVDFPYCFNIHGHNHNGGKKENHLNVCTELLNYKPISWKKILNSGILKNIPDIHRETIDEVIERKVPKNE